MKLKMPVLRKPVFIMLLLSLLTHSALTGQNSLQAEKAYNKAVEKLNKKSQIKKAMEVIDQLEPETEETLITLTEIPAPPFKEQKRAEKFRSLLEEAGVDKAWIDEEGNVIALRKGSGEGKVVALDAHMDTVFPEGTDVTVRRKGDTLYAPGIGDDTRGLAMVLTILKAMNAAKIKTRADILFIGTVGEEGLGDLRGVRHIFKENKLKIDSWISIDGGSLGRVNNAALGSKRYKAVFKGKGGHSWGAFGLANPHHALGMAIAEFREQAAEYTSKGEKTSFNIGRIGGGTSVNAIPFESWMEVDMRSVSVEHLQQIDNIFKASMQKALTEYNNSGVKDKVSLELIPIGDRPSGEHPADVPLVQRAIAVSNFIGANTQLTRGSTNANIPISQGVPAVTIGRGGKGGGAHSLGEWWINENGAAAIKLALLLTVLEAGLTP
ncbi:M20/M25/M40 family metallo-hydrolase [Leptobacterium flavescens]|uniref:M20/M25/M40 family metallo-hydrolase n=1 Tax=Leptobacterium flavescens TaxID=472055 RepID=A0A6P0UMZ7_9FLAO|nr:M20/M25/M40 family metallo-hydrolase [Leptobacterium flavescens]NER14397.1 M20/M25/M40 family metallo-hydrolase [Leptobacterium flavescens]